MSAMEKTERMSDVCVESIMSRRLQTLEEEDDLDLADMIMRLESVHHLPVVRDAELVGLVTHRDVLRAQISSVAGVDRAAERSVNLRIKIKEIMQTEVETISPRATIREAAISMREHYYGCLPVVEEGILVGIITGTDLLDFLIRELSK